MAEFTLGFCTSCNERTPANEAGRCFMCGCPHETEDETTCEHAQAPTGQLVENGQTDPTDSSKLLVVRLCPDCGDRVEFSVPKYRGGAARYGRGYYKRRR